MLPESRQVVKSITLKNLFESKVPMGSGGTTAQEGRAHSVGNQDFRGHRPCTDPYVVPLQNLQIRRASSYRAPSRCTRELPAP